MVAVVLFALLALVQGYATGSKAVLAYLGAMLMGTAMTPFSSPGFPAAPSPSREPSWVDLELHRCMGWPEATHGVR
jgi:hypothetical protein